MRISHAALPLIRLLVLLVFTAACAVFFGWLWVNSGGRLPFSSAGYRTSFTVAAVSNLVNDADVMVAGVPVGKVVEVTPDGAQAHVTVQLDSDVAPLHQGATVRIRQKTLVEESYVDVHDGGGTPLASGSALPPDAAKPAVELNDVLTSLEGGPRQELAGTLRSLGAATDGTAGDLAAALSGLGELGRQGKGAMDALAAQSDQLKRLTGDAATLVAALDTRQGQIAQLVSDADTLTRATSAGSGDIQTVMRELPGLLTTARSASTGLDQLSAALGPVAANLRTAAPDLDVALRQLPQTAADLRGLLPSLNGVLDRAPATLGRTPVLAADAHQLLPTLNVALGDVNPMLAYLQPYGRDIAAMFTNTGQALARGDGNGFALRAFLIFNEQSLSGLPLNLNRIPALDKWNPYPAPGQAARPGPFNGTYPHVRKEGN
ncbi:MCE family protein [Amycolatopsis sp. K13G38]|uniref:MCE family protein n=1 Tax=Amycolatopsis acididurans TaxID=2724524 RepID=A0ABX1JDC1_9PSEU|nr:MlaD family protein [Amycolatopsis acididurans]NKQ57734.1 MCE family protein [Amycolatopsis acididurans]